MFVNVVGFNVMRFLNGKKMNVLILNQKDIILFAKKILKQEKGEGEE